MARAREDQVKVLRSFTLDRFPALSGSIAVVFGVVRPFVPFCIMEADAADGYGTFFAEWQSGEFLDYVGLLVGGPASRPFYPLLLWAMASLLLVCIKPARFGRQTWAKLGLIFGVVLGFQYTVLLGVGGYESVLAATVGVVGAVLIGAVPGVATPRTLRLPRVNRTAVKIMWGVGLGAAALALALAFAASAVSGDWDGVFGALLGIPIGVSIMLSPGLFLLVYLWAVVRVWRTYEYWPPGGGFLLSTFGAAAGLIAAWALSILLAVRHYQTLPTTPPSCYIATAAARGHRWSCAPKSSRCPTADACPSPGNCKHSKPASWRSARHARRCTARCGRCTTASARRWPPGSATRCWPTWRTCRCSRSHGSPRASCGRSWARGRSPASIGADRPPLQSRPCPSRSDSSPGAAACPCSKPRACGPRAGKWYAPRSGG